MTDKEDTISDDALAERALGLILDDEAVNIAVEEHTRVKLGRGPHPDRDEDTEWWDMVTHVYNELMARMTTLLNVGYAKN